MKSAVGNPDGTLHHIMNIVEQLYLTYTGHEATHVQSIAGAGSPRHYYRLFHLPVR